MICTRFTLLMLFLAMYDSCFAETKQTISVTDFGARPNDAFNDRSAIQKAINYCREKHISKLLFPPGEYKVSDPQALRIQQNAMTGKMGKNPQDSLFKPNQEYVIGLDFNGTKNLTVNAKGVTLMIDGWMEPICLRNCENLTLNGLIIDYKTKPNNQGIIEHVGTDYVDVKFAKNEMPLASQIVLRIMIYDKSMKSFIGAGVYQDRMEVLSQNMIRFYGSAVRELAKPGRVLITFSGFHYRPAILVYKAINVTLNDVSIYAQPGMGIVGHLSENITMNRLKIVPGSGRYASTNTDATHFATNRGLIRFNQCEFAGHGDDATNVHTYYTSAFNNNVDKKICEIGVDRRNYTHSSYLDEPREGDVLAVVDRQTLQEVGYIRVRHYWPEPLKDKVILEYDGVLPADIPKYYLINITALPALEFENCKVHSHRARSVLVKTRKVLIRNNTFEHTTGTAIHVGVEGDWGEGPASEDVIIEGNSFRDCGLGGSNDGTLDGASAIALHVKARNNKVAGLHKRILIENNTVNGGKHAIVVKGAEDVTIQNNFFNNLKDAPIVVDVSSRVKIRDNKGVKYEGEAQAVLPNYHK